MNLKRVRVLVVACLVLPLSAWPQARLAPVDQAATVPDFFSFRARLQAAVARRDVAETTAAFSRNVKLSFGGDVGPQAFERLWRPRAPDSTLWATLGTVLALGGTFSGDASFTAPYVSARWPQGLDAFDHVAVLGAAVRVRESPQAGAPTLGLLDHAIVEVAEPAAAAAPWVKVKLPSGQAGYVDSRMVRSPIDYRVRFARMDGRWQIVSFLAGD